MRCRTCGQKAAINMRQHKLSLCRQHYLEWLPNQVERFIRKYHMFTKYDRVLVAVSGGKDSLALWDILWKLGYQTEGVYIHLGIQGDDAYSDQSMNYAQQFANLREIKLHVVDIKKQYAESIPEISLRTKRGREKPCSVCGLIKRYILNQTAVNEYFDVLVTAHNLDDETAILLANTLDWSLDHLARGEPVLPKTPGFSKKAKPFCRIYEREAAAYTILSGIEFVREECPYSVGNKQLFHKKHLNEWEDESPGTKLRFYLKYLAALEKGAFPKRQDSAENLRHQLCPNCGYPTSTDGLCAFCRLFKVK